LPEALILGPRSQTIESRPSSPLLDGRNQLSAIFSRLLNADFSIWVVLFFVDGQQQSAGFCHLLTATNCLQNTGQLLFSVVFRRLQIKYAFAKLHALTNFKL
jgi:hypothetical protein